MRKSNFKTVILYVVLIGVVLFVATQLLGEASPKDEITTQDIFGYFERGEVASFELDQDANLVLVLTDEKKTEIKARLLDYELFRDEIFVPLILDNPDNTVEYNFKEPTQIPWWVEFLPYVIIFVLFIGFWIFMMNQATGRGGKMNSFGRARAKLSIGDKVKVRFSDVAGCDEEKQELAEVVDFLRDPERYRKLGAKIPKGALLVGPPGTGKTLLAKAVAGEAGVPFYSISGSDFVEMYVGVGASRVRDLFETARRNPAAIIFIDEIDAVGRHRGAGLGGGHDEREQTLNQLLVEMDGFDGRESVIVMAATNRPDILDPALLRPGRFDRQITVGYPDLRGREEILKVHAKGKPFEEGVDFSRIAQTTVGFTGADLANLLNESALIAARKRKLLIGMNDIEEASLKIVVGTPKKSYKIKEQEKLKTAYHEAGHAIIAHVLKTLDPVRLISIVPSGRALGYTLTPPKEDKYSEYKCALKDEIAMLLGGRAAESIVFDDVSGGASNDIQRATGIARKMVTRLGMSDELGPILYGSEHSGDEVFLGRDFSSDKNYSEQTAALIDAEIKKIISEAYDRARDILRENIEKMHFIAKFLVDHETMDDAQFTAVMEREVTVEELEAMTAERERKSREENERRREIEEAEAREREEAEARERDRYDREERGTSDGSDSDSDADSDSDDSVGH
ncbi:MAG: ATP-dependent zinc metalloprotease FtsH [Clostridia bacterium]|nr:ATP-dependent zinc metalloprotease FtsH [Clostridia bacterium]